MATATPTLAPAPVPAPALTPTQTQTQTQTRSNAAAMPRKVWQHPDPQSAGIEKFRRHINAKFNVNLQVCSVTPSGRPAVRPPVTTPYG